MYKKHNNIYKPIYASDMVVLAPCPTTCNRKIYEKLTQNTVETGNIKQIPIIKIGQ